MGQLQYIDLSKTFFRKYSFQHYLHQQITNNIVGLKGVYFILPWIRCWCITLKFPLISTPTETVLLLNVNIPIASNTINTPIFNTKKVKKFYHCSNLFHQHKSFITCRSISKFFLNKFHNENDVVRCDFRMLAWRWHHR